MSAKYEESKHYGGEAIIRFYPGEHYYTVTDSFTDEDGRKIELDEARMGGATSLTGTLAKGQGLMMYPMKEMKKHLKKYFRSNSLEDIFNEKRSLENLLNEATRAHTIKSDRGKNVGTDAHAWVELYVRECMRVQKAHNIEQTYGASSFKDFVLPEISPVESVVTKLRASYINMFKNSKIKNLKPEDPEYATKVIEEYKKLPKLLLHDAEIQEAMHIEATMLHRSTSAAKRWFELHDVFVHGTEDTVYSRIMQVCGKYDIDISVTCSQRCNWCYLNGHEDKIIELINKHGEDYKYTGRYIADFKSTNSSNEAPKGIYGEYLGQCGVYDVAKTEEFPDIVFDGHLILNGSKNNGTFATHFSFQRDRNCAWAYTMADNREFIYSARKEVEHSL